MRTAILALVIVAAACSPVQAADSPKTEEGKIGKIESGIINVPFRLQQSNTGPILAPAYPEAITGEGIDDLKKFSRGRVTGTTPVWTTTALGVTGTRSDTELHLSYAVLVFGFLVVLAEIFIMFRQNQGWDTQSTRIVGLTLIIVCGVFLITSGYSQNQIAPMIGLLGAAVGYLLGKTGGNKRAREASSAPK